MMLLYIYSRLEQTILYMSGVDALRKDMHKVEYVDECKHQCNKNMYNSADENGPSMPFHLI